nr:thioredoxin domain-containing protein [Anaerolineae bacterium]
MPNRLSSETSPYLLQHKDNPVDWYPWCEEAFERAKAEDKPVFLSIGYSACHWCHVMAHESFEDASTADVMNRHFVNIKVDREERPDVDSVYMNAVQALTGRGGWPLSVWLLPDGRPFYGGTYFPNTPRYGMPSFVQVLERIVEVYREKRTRLDSDAAQLTRAISGRIQLEEAGGKLLSPGLLDRAADQLLSRFDKQYGGFGEQPKFPPSMTLDFLLRHYARTRSLDSLRMVTHTLDRMMAGGIYDQLGGGFHRYSVDNRWLVPHFEKMLYDNALLIRIYAQAYQVTGKSAYRQVVEQTVDYIKREMTDRHGGFYSSQDADSEGKEGEYYIWSVEAIREALSDTPCLEAVLSYWGLDRNPNFEGHYILWVPGALDDVAQAHQIPSASLAGAIEEARQELFSTRGTRLAPACDDKILTAWNGLMIHSLALAGRILGSGEFLEMAVRAADFILGRMRPNGRLQRTYRNGQARYHSCLEDHAFLIEGLIELYQATGNERWFDEMLALTGQMLDLFWDDEAGFYDTAHDSEALITRPQELGDNAIPSGTSAAVSVLVRVSRLADKPDYLSRAERIAARLSASVEQYPAAFGYLAAQFEFMLGHPTEIVVVGSPSSAEAVALWDELRRHYLPNAILVTYDPALQSTANQIPLIGGRNLVRGKPAAYVCHNYTCQKPALSPDELRKQLGVE